MPPIDNHYWWLMDSKSEIRVIETALDLFRLDNGRYPTEAEGIQILVSEASVNLPKWKQYMKEIPMDTWDESYVYELNSDSTNFVLYSKGPNKIASSGNGDDVIGGEKEYSCEIFNDCRTFGHHVSIATFYIALVSLLLLIVSACYYLIRFVWRTIKKNKA